ncbi:MAG: zeta toxin [Candidatus Melainabacteria bacterium]|nr:MAG: zeta toxin [Candidatus Melainabacteria bacterium]
MYKLILGLIILNSNNLCYYLLMKNPNKTLYIISGANGSGKSTLAEVLLKEKNLEFLNADEIAKEICPDAINSVPISAGKLYFKRLNEYFQNNKSFAVESTLSGNNIVRIIEKAKQKNYKIILIYSFLKNCAVCIERVKRRVENGGHNVPEEDIIRRYYKSIVKFWDDIVLWLMNGLCFIMDMNMHQLLFLLEQKTILVR